MGVLSLLFLYKSITHEIFESCDCNPSLKIRSVFPDISKAFDKVWHNKCLLYELIENYLSGRFQRVISNGETSWRPILAGVTLGSIVGPFLFLIYINDLLNGLKTNAKLFADDATLFTIVKDKNESASVPNNDLSLIWKWNFNWRMLFNPDHHKPAEEVLSSRKQKVLIHPFISLFQVESHLVGESILLKTSWFICWWKTHFRTSYWSYALKS